MAKNIAVIGGGNSGERDISLQSLQNVYNSLDKNKFNVYKFVLTGSYIECQLEEGNAAVDLNDFSFIQNHKRVKIDFVFNVIHGTPGENGYLQGLLEILKIPYNASNVLTSAVTFNKAWTKRFLHDLEHVHFAKSVVVNSITPEVFDAIESTLGFPCFVKPNKGGSSVGISRVDTKEELEKALTSALSEDDEIIIEEYIQGTEITCGVALVDGAPKAIGITEIVFTTHFFDFNAKYTDKTTQEITPARISEDLYKRCELVSEQIFTLFECKSFVRIDYIIKDEKLYFIEVNTIPGLTDASLIPQHFEYQKINLTNYFSNLIDYYGN